MLEDMEQNGQILTEPDSVVSARCYCPHFLPVPASQEWRIAHRSWEWGSVVERLASVLIDDGESAAERRPIPFNGDTLSSGAFRFLRMKLLQETEESLR